MQPERTFRYQRQLKPRDWMSAGVTAAFSARLMVISRRFMAQKHEQMFGCLSRTNVLRSNPCSGRGRYAYRMKRKYPDAVTTINAAMDAIAEARGWDLEQWCKKADVAYRTVQHWRVKENATRNPSVSILQKLADVANVPFSLMSVSGLTAEDVRNRTTERMVVNLTNCTKETRAYILQIIERDLNNIKQA